MDQSREKLQNRIAQIKDRPLQELLRDLTDSAFKWGQGYQEAVTTDRWITVGGQTVRGTTAQEKAPETVGGQTDGQGQTIAAKDGKDGKDGRDGIDGKDGAPGPAGVDGAPGPAGPAGPTINHDLLPGLNVGDYQHLSAAQKTDLTDAGDSALHYHATDRARTNHTGTQLAATISDFSTAADARITAQKGFANGIAPLGSDTRIPLSYLPATTIVETSVVASQAAMLALTAQQGDVAVRTDLSKTFILKTEPASTLANWQELLSPTDAVVSVFGRTGPVTAQVGDYSAFYQPLDADLTAIAALATTSYGRSFLTLADAAAARSLIGAQVAGSYETSITAGTTAQYWRGDKSWQTLNAAAVGLGNVLNVAQEPALGNPGTSGFLLSSTTAGVRSWVAPYSHPATHPQSVVDSASGWITTALAGKQPLDADLTAVAALATTGFVRRTATDTWAASAMAWSDISGVISYGTTAGTVCQGNDSRLSDSRTPTAHALDGALHTISGKTAGQLLLATAATTFAFTTLSGDATLSGAGALTLASVIAAGGPIGSASVVPVITYDAKGRLTAVSSATITPAAIGAATAASLANYLPLAGGTLTGPLGGTTASFIAAGSTVPVGVMALSEYQTGNPQYGNGVMLDFGLSNNGLAPVARGRISVINTSYKSQADMVLYNAKADVLVEALRLRGSDNAAIFGGSVTSTSFIKNGGTSAQFLKADGSIDSSTYALTASLAYYVTTNSDQTVGGIKTFSNTVILGEPYGFALGGTSTFWLRSPSAGAAFQVEVGGQVVQTFARDGLSMKTWKSLEGASEIYSSGSWVGSAYAASDTLSSASRIGVTSSNKQNGWLLSYGASGDLQFHASTANNWSKKASLDTSGNFTMRDAIITNQIRMTPWVTVTNSTPYQVPAGTYDGQMILVKGANISGGVCQVYGSVTSRVRFRVRTTGVFTSSVNDTVYYDVSGMMVMLVWNSSDASWTLWD